MEKFNQVSYLDVLEFGKILEPYGYTVKTHSYDIPIEPGSYYSCHAEKKLSLLSNKPVGVTKPMCPDCKDYFTVLAVYRQVELVVADPKVLRIFTIDGGKPLEYTY